MRLFYPGQIAIPLMLILAAGLFLMGRFDMIQIARYQELWPVTLIAAGLEELYLWATSGDDQ
jgi:cell wall-active antibiotic response 4TMS protein YvqF